MGGQDCEIAPQACTCHANLPGTIGPRRGPGWGEPGKDAGTALMGGTPPRLDPRTNPKCANTAWELGGRPSSRPSLRHFVLQRAQGVREGPASGIGGYTAQHFRFLPSSEHPGTLLCEDTYSHKYSHPQFESRTTPLSGFVGAAQGWASQDSGHPGVCGQPRDPKPLGHCRLWGVGEAQLGGIRPPCPHSFVPTFPGMWCPCPPEAG